MKWLCLLLLLTTTCAQAPLAARTCDTYTAENVIYAAKLEASMSMEADNQSEKVRHAGKGLDWAEKCVVSYPREAGCYFYRAVTRELYTELTMSKFRKAIKKIIADCKQVIALDKTFDNGGAYRDAAQKLLAKAEKRLTK
ncbi:MAG: hypothetical protein HY541_04005 [Deltaproteobacteria bacterium]|nr:hypothetical protein [Deltaproteobacteria bacterium]